MRNLATCHSERSEESRTSFASRARFLAQFTLNGQSEIPRFARNDSEGLGMTHRRGMKNPVGGRLAVPCGGVGQALPLQSAGKRR
jgi:hypothetical protein